MSRQAEVLDIDCLPCRFNGDKARSNPVRDLPMCTHLQAGRFGIRFRQTRHRADASGLRRPFAIDRIWQTLVLSFVILVGVAGATEAEESPTEVGIVLPKNLVLPKTNLLIYRVPDAKNDWPVVQADVAIENSEVKVSLPEGDYVAEIGVVADSVLVLLRSPPFSVPKTTRVALLAEKHTCGATIASKSAHLRQVALRRFGNGEIRWSVENSPPPVLLVTSPGAVYVASCIAKLGHKYLAMWTPKEAIKKPRLSFSESDAPHHFKFALREGTPVLSSSQVTLYFPDTHFTIDEPTQAVLMTDRDRAFCDYELKTKAGETLYFSGGICQDANSSIFRMGGPLTPKMFAGFIWSENGNVWDAGTLYTRVELVDADGRIFDGSKSQLNLRTELFFSPDQQKPVPLPGHEPGWSGFKAESISANVHYTYGGHSITSECRGEELVRVASEHFSIGAPSMWMFKARQYLSCLEAIRLLTMKNTGRPGPASFRVDWRSNGDSAKSIVGSAEGGGPDLWMSFPWWTFDGFWDPFTEPWFGNHDPYVCHEVLHAFGYHHGDEMSQLEWRAEDQYRTLRWRSVDTGEWQVWQTRLPAEQKSSD
jgi:hypothetical protein